MDRYRSVGHLVPGRTERINNLHYFRFIYYLSLNDVLFWKMTRFALLHPSMTHSWRMSRRLSRSCVTLPLKVSPWKYCLTLNRSVAQRGLGTTVIDHLWRDLKTAVGRRHPWNLRHLEHLAKEEWSKIPVERCNKLIDGYGKQWLSVIFSIDTFLTLKPWLFQYLMMWNNMAFRRNCNCDTINKQK